METITISKEFAYGCAAALVDIHNTKYDDMSPSCKLYSFMGLYSDLKTLGAEKLIATAKGDDDIRGLTFNPSQEKRVVFAKKHGIKIKLNI